MTGREKGGIIALNDKNKNQRGEIAMLSRRREKKSRKVGFVVVLLCIICAPIFPLMSAFFITRLPPPAAKTCYKITMATIYIEVILLLMVAVISFIHDP